MIPPGKCFCYENKVLSRESVDKMQTKPHCCYLCSMAHLLPRFGSGIQVGSEEGKGVGKTLATAAIKYDDGNDIGYLKHIFFCKTNGCSSKSMLLESLSTKNMK